MNVVNKSAYNNRGTAQFTENACHIRMNLGSNGFAQIRFMVFRAEHDMHIQLAK